MTTILIVDSYLCVLDLLREELTAEGYTVVGTGNLSSIRVLVESSKPNLIILDLYHDRKERWDVLLDIKKQYPHLPVIIFTAYAGYKKDPRVSQAEGFVIKSLFLDELKQKIDQVKKYRPIPLSNGDGELLHSSL